MAQRQEAATFKMRLGRRIINFEMLVLAFSILIATGSLIKGSISDCILLIGANAIYVLLSKAEKYIGKLTAADKLAVTFAIVVPAGSLGKGYTLVPLAGCIAACCFIATLIYSRNVKEKPETTEPR